jgi:hypothetical protein
MILYLVIFIVIVVLWLILLLKFRKRKNKISQSKISFFNKQLNEILINSSYKEQIIDIDKLYHKILIQWWYSWTFWEILKTEPIEIWNLQTIWELHKLRNKLVHDFDLLSESILKKNADKYKKEVLNLIKKFK